ncbi:GA2L1 protein, partial [Upupa epops]|nr:GA2L1 protein [Upupa epops]
MADPSHIQSAASKSIRPFRSSEEYLEAMKEDLAEWFNTLYDLDLQADTFLESLATGGHLCHHANTVTRAARDFQRRHPEAAARLRLPRADVVFQAKNVAPGSFVARDNVSNFIRWCRHDLGIQDVLMFETNDLVLKKNEKNVVLCLLEVARRGSKFGMLAPMLIQMEEEIDEEMRDHLAYREALGSRRHSQDPPAATFPARARPMTLCDLKNLDELPNRVLCGPQEVPEDSGSWGGPNCLSSPLVVHSGCLVRCSVAHLSAQWPLYGTSEGQPISVCPLGSHRLPQSLTPGFSPQKTAPGSFSPASRSSSPSTPRRPRSTGPSSVSGDTNHMKSEHGSHQPKGVGDTPRAKQEGLPPRGGPRSLSGSASPMRSPAEVRAAGTLRARDPTRSRRCSGDSDSSASSAQSCPVAQRDPGIPSHCRRSDTPNRGGVPPASPSPSGRTAPDERGRSRAPNGPGRPPPRARSHGRPDPQPLLLISRRQDGQHSWTRADPPSRNRTPARSPEKGSKGQRAAGGHDGGHDGSHSGQTLECELEELVQRLRAPLEPSQEQLLFRRLEEEFLANTRLMEELEDGETPVVPPPPPATAAPDSAYCSSSSSSSSLNVFGKHGLPGNNG